MLSAFGNILGRPLGWFLGQSPVNEDGSLPVSSSSTGSSLPASMDSLGLEDYEPTVADVFVVKAMLNKALALPLELIDAIIDMAEYWPHSTAIEQQATVISGGRAPLENKLLVTSKPLGFINRSVGALPMLKKARSSAISPLNRPIKKPFTADQWQTTLGAPEKLLEHPCRKIVFTIRSRDQGWSGDHNDHGTYRGSFTWFDAGLERFDSQGVLDEDEELDTPDFHASRLRSIWPDVREEHDRPDPPIQYRGGPSDNTEPLYPEPPPKSYRLVHELLHDQRHMIQANVHAKGEPTDHKVVWSWTDDIDGNSPEAEELLAKGRGKYTGNGEFVRSLTLGDVVSVWGRARFGAWRNIVDRVQVDVYWAV